MRLPLHRAGGFIKVLSNSRSLMAAGAEVPPELPLEVPPHFSLCYEGLKYL